ncbi:hypothetical protein FRC0293_01865 [Corynebacterium diphtheriae]|nr:hypothetical protein FRC0293_01865 [Corynebacterium diphtheriae]CAB0857519.1 hypothetical protein FRC0294_01867 [Corynebacterium diphtheriae]
MLPTPLEWGVFLVFPLNDFWLKGQKGIPLGIDSRVIGGWSTISMAAALDFFLGLGRPCLLFAFASEILLKSQL